RDLFHRLKWAQDVKAVVLVGAGGNFCSGGDVHEIIGPLVQLKAPELLMFTRMTGELVKTMRACPQPIIAAVDGVCAGAGAIMAMASDMRLGTVRSKTAFLFNRVGLAGCDMGACAILPRIIGQGRASELLYTGRSLGGEEGERWGFFNRLCEPEAVLAQAQQLAAELAAGPSFANGITKTMLHQEWAMTVEQAIEAEAQAQALCMLTQDYGRAYHAFVAKQKPVFKGN
ncbi:MAG: enoyl-CoA hydratase family protein, partial [Comamonas sp.]|nr:enoyl-CoA hydratase family protein [Comamonas sp.]